MTSVWSIKGLRRLSHYSYLTLPNLFTSKCCSSSYLCQWMQHFLKCLRKIWITKLDRLLPCNVSGLESGQQPCYFKETAMQKYTGETLCKKITASNFWKYAYLTCLGWKPDPTPVVLDLVDVKKLTYRSNKKWSLYLIKKNLIHIQWGLVYNLLRPVFSESLTQIYWDMWLLAYYITIFYLYNI